MKSVESKKCPVQIGTSVMTWGFKITAILMFCFLFIGGLNPARFTTNVNSNVSIVKSAFYFQSYAQTFVDAEKSALAELAKQDESAAAVSNNNQQESDEDMYAMFAEMFANSEDEFNNASTVSDDDELLSFDQAGKIKANKFKNTWTEFSEKYDTLSSAVNKAHFASIFTFFTVLLVLFGTFLTYSSIKIKKTGIFVIILASVLTAVSMFLYVSASSVLSQNVPFFLETASIKTEVRVFVIFSVLTALFAAASLLLGKKGVKNSVDSGVSVESLKSESKIITSLNPQPFQWSYRVLSLLLFILLFIPAANPARISSEISRNVSLFTSAISWPTYTKNIERAFIRGWLPEYVMRIASISSLLTVLGIFACGVGACMSVGNNKLKKYAHFTLAGGAIVSFGSLFGIKHAYNLICANTEIERVPPMEPACLTLYLVLISIIFACTIVSFVKTPTAEKDEKCSIEPKYQLFLMYLPFLILVFIFSYLPLWGWRYAFFDYNPGETLSMDKWTGWKWFVEIFQNQARRDDIIRVIRNTLVMSGLGIAFSWLPMIFAIFLSEIKSTKARKVIQTLTTIPNFISWVLVYAIAFCIFGTDGFVSSLMQKAGLWTEGKNMLMGEQGIWIKMWAWGTWKGLGWSAIMYIAAISGIDQQLYEAATVDGAGRFQKMWHITIPELLPTFLVLLILSVSNILSNGMDQYLVFKNPTNQKPIEVLDLYVYNLTFGTSNSMIPFSTVVSMFKSLISVVLLFITNRISKAIRGSSIF